MRTIKTKNNGLFFNIKNKPELYKSQVSSAGRNITTNTTLKAPTAKSFIKNSNFNYCRL